VRRVVQSQVHRKDAKDAKENTKKTEDRRQGQIANASLEQAPFPRPLSSVFSCLSLASGGLNGLHEITRVEPFSCVCPMSPLSAATAARKPLVVKVHTTRAFSASARSIRHRTRPRPSWRAAVAQICRGLDGVASSDRFPSRSTVSFIGCRGTIFFGRQGAVIQATIPRDAISMPLIA